MSNDGLPPTWSWTTLEEVADVITGNTPPTSRPEYYGGLIPFIKPPQLNDRVVTKTEETISEVGIPYTRLAPPDSVLVCCIGSLGKTGFTTQTSAFNQQINAVVFRGGIDAHFGFFACQLLRDFLESVASATTIAIVNKSKFSKAPIPIAPLNEQHRIVAEIEKQFTRLDAAVAALKRVQANLKRYRASVLKAACEGRLVTTEAELARAEGRDYEPADRQLERILKERRAKWEADQIAKMKAEGKPPKDDKWKDRYPEPAQLNAGDLPHIPEGWVWTSIDHLAVVVRGASPRPAGDPKYFGGSIPWITVGALTSDEQPYLHEVSDTVTEAGCKASRYIEPNTLLLTNSGATLGVPKITLIGGCINDGSVALLHTDYPLRLYLYYYLRSQTKKLRAINQGAAQPNLNTSIVKSILVPLPPLAEIERIIEELERKRSVIEESEAIVGSNLKRAKRLRQAILKQAFEGKLVPQDPNDEPASVLLERIRPERENNKPAPKPTRTKRKGKAPDQGRLTFAD